jgi:MYXO-CTERM domain-containing protein
MKSANQTTFTPKRAHPVGLMHLGILIALLMPFLAAHQASADFSGPYDPANWTLNANGGNGFADTTAAPISITLWGSDDGSGFQTDTDYTVAAVASGTWSFDWFYTTVDGFNWDSGGYLLNGVFTQLAGPNLGAPLGGSVSIGVNAGDIIGFRVYSVDNYGGPARLDVTNFVGPVPAPGALAMLGLAGLVGRSRRRRL